MIRSNIDVVHVGAAARDLTADGPRGWRLGGGATYAALTTARLGLRTAARIGVDAAAAASDEIAVLRAAGVELDLVAIDEGPVFENLERPTGRIQRALAVGRAIAPSPVPARWREARGWSLLPVAAELDEDWAERVPPSAIVALGWQGLLRTLVAGEQVRRKAPAPSALVRRADVVGVSRQDLPPGTQPAALFALLHPGATLIVTEGAAGGTWFSQDPAVSPDGVSYPPALAPLLDDPTGAGDVFLAAYHATRLRPALLGVPPDRPDAALAFAAAAAACVVEGPGIASVPDLAAVRARLRR